MIKLLLAIALIMLMANVQLKFEHSFVCKSVCRNQTISVQKHKNVKWFINYFS
jgi:hypothetical protein